MSEIEPENPDGQPQEPRVQVVSEPLTYHRHSRTSFFRDMVLASRDVGAAQRLERHSNEMRVISEKRNAEAWQRINDAKFETRTLPDTSAGTGGNFTVPLWLNDEFATAPRPNRVLANLIRNRFDLPDGVSSVNVPILTTGTLTAPMVDNADGTDQDIEDAASSSTVATIEGHSDQALQLLEQSPAGAHMDWAIFEDLTADADAQLEAQLLSGAGAASKQILGVLNVSGTVGVTYTDGSPTGSALYPYLGQAGARVGNNRKLAPECWLMRTARWMWLTTSEDTAQLPFGIPAPFFLGDDTRTPNPVSGIGGFPVFTDDALPANLGDGENQDVIAALRPSDLILLEGTPVTSVMREPLSSTLGVRLQFHQKVAAITNRYPSGISPITGTGLVVQTGFDN